MATVVNPSSNQIRLNNGQIVTAQNGGWYDAQQYFNGTLGGAGIGNNPNQTDIYGKQAPTFNPQDAAYVAAQQKANPTPSAPAPANNPSTAGSTSTPTPNGSLALPTVPTLDLQGLTNSLLNTPEIQAAQKAISDRQQALADATGNINDNPFYSEATRVGKLAKLTEQANNDIKVQQDNLASLKADAQIKINAAQGQYNIDEQSYKDKISMFNDLISNGGLNNASGTDLANLAVQVGIPVSMLQSIQQAAQAKNAVKPQIVTSTDNNGNLNIIAIDPSTGNVINQSSIAGAGKATASGTKSDETAQNTQNLITDIKKKITLKSLIQYWSGVLPVDQIYSLYNQYSPWGQATETLAQVKQGKFAY